MGVIKLWDHTAQQPTLTLEAVKFLPENPCYQATGPYGFMVAFPIF